MDRLRHDLRFALRGLLRRPGFTAVVVLTLALGIGANSAIFSVVNGVLLRPLPYDRPAEVATIWVSWPGNPQGELSQPEYWDLREQNRSFTRLAAYADGSLTLTGSGDPERLRAGFVSADALPLLGVAPARGRAFSPDDDRPGAPVVVLIGDGLWRRRFGGRSRCGGPHGHARRRARDDRRSDGPRLPAADPLRGLRRRGLGAAAAGSRDRPLGARLALGECDGAAAARGGHRHGEPGGRRPRPSHARDLSHRVQAQLRRFRRDRGRRPGGRDSARHPRPARCGGAAPPHRLRQRGQSAARPGGGAAAGDRRAHGPRRRHR